MHHNNCNSKITTYSLSKGQHNISKTHTSNLNISQIINKATQTLSFDHNINCRHFREPGLFSVATPVRPKISLYFRCPIKLKISIHQTPSQPISFIRKRCLPLAASSHARPVLGPHTPSLPHGTDAAVLRPPPTSSPYALPRRRRHVPGSDPHSLASVVCPRANDRGTAEVPNQDQQLLSGLFLSMMEGVHHDVVSAISSNKV